MSRTVELRAAIHGLLTSAASLNNQAVALSKVERPSQVEDEIDRLEQEIERLRVAAILLKHEVTRPTSIPVLGIVQ